MKYTVIQKTFVVGVFSLLLVAALPFFLTEKVEAAGLTLAMVRPDRLASSTATGGMICAKSTTVDVETQVKVTFPTGFATVDTPANWTVTTTNIPSDATAWIGIGTATAATGQDVTFPSGDMVVGTLYCFNFTATSTLTTHATPGNNYTGTITTQKSGPTTIDTSGFALSVVSNDQVVVNATVPATFSFSLPTNTLTFLSNLTTTPVLTGTSVATIATNAHSGWVAWVKSANAALNSASTGATIPTAGSIDNAVTDVSATNGYFLDVAFTDSGVGTGTVTQAANYGQEYDGDATHGGTLSTTFQPVAASSGTTDGDTLTFTALAKISAVQAAASDYTDTLTIIAAGRF
jgi:hypothetical protein